VRKLVKGRFWRKHAFIQQCLSGKEYILNRFECSETISLFLKFGYFWPFSCLKNKNLHLLSLSNFPILLSQIFEPQNICSNAKKTSIS